MNLNTLSPNPSACLKTKVFSFSSLLLCSFLIVGCGSSSSDDDDKQKREACFPSSTDICTAEQFVNATRDNPNGTYKLGDDIDLVNYSGWTPIGSYDAPFAGTLDGSGYKIKGLKFKDVSDEQYIGLFGYINGAHIQDLSVEVANNDTISLTDSDDQYFGIIAGYATGANLEKITVSSTEPLTIYKNTTNTLYIGGLVGVANSTSIEKSTSSVTFNAVNNATTPSTAYAGGITGSNVNGDINNTYTTGNISANGNSETYAGGIAGNNGQGAVISKSYASGDIFAGGLYSAYAGGIAGTNIDGTIGTSAALNLNVTASIFIDTSSSYARRIAYDGNFPNNFALSDMTLTQKGNYTINDSAYNSEDGGNKTLKELQEQATYKGNLGWDFDTNTTWQWDNSKRRPVLY